MKDALVSVIIPVYNGERYLSEAIKSIVTQTYQPLEIIIVDDGSSDASAQVAQTFGKSVRYVFQPHTGIGAALNRGIELAQGTLFAFLDQDDLWISNKIQLQIAAIENDPGLDLVFGYVEQFYTPGLNTDTKNRIRCPNAPMPGYLRGSMLATRQAFIRVGVFSNYRTGNFIDWYMRAQEYKLTSVMLPVVLIKRRVHSTNTARDKRIWVDYARIIKAGLDRRRKI